MSEYLEQAGRIFIQQTNYNLTIGEEFQFNLELPIMVTPHWEPLQAVYGVDNIDNHASDTDYSSNHITGMNGRLDRKDLMNIQPGHYLRKDAGKAFLELKSKAKQEGIRLIVTDSYRDLAAQIDVFRRKPKLAAQPGTSLHGWGIALDLSVGGFTSAVYVWLYKNGPAYGWINPPWAHDGKGKEEPWHWEYVGVKK